MHNKIELLDNGVIYVEKVGDQTEASLNALFEQISGYAKQLRTSNKRVLILSNAAHEGQMDIAAKRAAARIGKQLDYDKSATYGSSLFLTKVRKLMISATRLDTKVANFRTREEALKWLLG